jgi:hypothetical protein
VIQQGPGFYEINGDDEEYGAAWHGTGFVFGFGFSFGLALSDFSVQASRSLSHSAE